MRLVELPVLPSEPRCPAARAIAGACAAEQGVVCVVMQHDHEDDPGLGMSAAQTGFVHHEATGGVFLTVKSDPSTVTKFCHGDAIPVLDDEDVAGGRASYTYCPTWQAEKARIWEGRDDLLPSVPDPEPVAHGVTASSEDDPWAAARDVELLAS
jgi:hypothetical protein